MSDLLAVIKCKMQRERWRAKLTLTTGGSSNISYFLKRFSWLCFEGNRLAFFALLSTLFLVNGVSNTDGRSGGWRERKREREREVGEGKAVKGFLKSATTLKQVDHAYSQWSKQFINHPNKIKLLHTIANPVEAHSLYDKRELPTQFHFTMKGKQSSFSKTRPTNMLKSLLLYKNPNANQQRILAIPLYKRKIHTIYFNLKQYTYHHKEWGLLFGTGLKNSAIFCVPFRTSLNKCGQSVCGEMQSISFTG